MGNAFSNQEAQPLNSSMDNMKPSQYSNNTFPQYTNFLNSSTYNEVDASNTTADDKGSSYRSYPQIL